MVKKKIETRQYKDSSGHIVRRELTRNKPLPPVPADTRDLTGRICGDPLPGRSALDKIRSQQNA